MSRSVYEAANSVEANLIKNLLEQAAVPSRVDGEYLQGGIGEIQAHGLVRVVVNDEDYERARAVIDDWNATEVASEAEPDPQPGTLISKPKTNKLGVWLIGFLCGIGVAMGHAYLNRPPAFYNGIDHNGDGELDEFWHFENSLLTRSEQDRNFDGSIDLVWHFDRKGVLTSSEADDDFNGSFETATTIRQGSPTMTFTDTTGDAIKDLRTDYVDGIPRTIKYLHPKSRIAIQTQHFGPFKLERTELDLDGNGTVDTIYAYDADGVVTVHTVEQAD